MNKNKMLSMMLAMISSISMIVVMPLTAYADDNDTVSNDNSSYHVLNYDLKQHKYVNMDGFNDNLDNSLNNIDTGSMIHHGNVSIDDFNNVFNDSTNNSRAIIGDDDRVKANINDSITWGTALVISKYTDDSISKCSSSIISKNILLTAAHCVSDAETLANAEYVTVYPGRSDGNMPMGFYEVTNFYLLKGWDVKYNGEHYSDSRYDISLLRISPDEDGKYPTDYGAPIYGYGYYEDKELNGSNVVAFGYPGDHDKENETLDVMYAMRNGKISTNKQDYDDFNNVRKEISNTKNSNSSVGVLSNKDTLMHTLDTTQGSSGAGLIKTYSSAIIIGINSRECDDTKYNQCIKQDKSHIMNTAARINKTVYNTITNIINDNKVKD